MPFIFLFLSILTMVLAIAGLFVAGMVLFLGPPADLALVLITVLGASWYFILMFELALGLWYEFINQQRFF